MALYKLCYLLTQTSQHTVPHTAAQIPGNMAFVIFKRNSQDFSQV